MRYLIFISLMTVSITSFATRLQITYQGGWPATLLSEKPIGLSVFTQRATLSGVGFYVSIPVYKTLHLGFHTNILTSKTNGDNIARFLSDRYDNNNYYVKQTGGISEMYGDMFGLDLSYNINLKYFDVEPFIRSGIASADYSAQNVKINRKKKNENYFEDYTLMVRAKAYGYYGGGIKVHRKLLPWLYVETGISYISGKAPFELVEEKTDFIGTAYPTNYTRFTTMMNTTQFEIGIQFRLGKDMK